MRPTIAEPAIKATGLSGLDIARNRATRPRAAKIRKSLPAALFMDISLSVHS